MRMRGLVPIAILAAACDSRSGAGFRLPNGAANVTLGGKTTWVKTYGELVTAIANPSHRLTRRYPADEVAVEGESLMALAYLNDVMTLQQLIDLVAFLQSTYEVVPPPIEPYYWPAIR
jgi:sulfur-oxidizing protein SoxX